MKSWTIPLAACVAALTGAPALCGQPDGPLPTARALLGDALFSEMIATISGHSTLDIGRSRDAPPLVDFVEVGDVIPYEGMQLMVGPKLDGLYEPASRTIFLVRPWSLVDIRDQAVLLHELVHDAQTAGDHPCLGIGERDAHVVHDAFLADRGLESGFDFEAIAEAASCAR